MKLSDVIRRCVRDFWKKTAVVAVAYCGTGLLSGYFAIPPGYASPVWPAAGIALLAALYWKKYSYLGIWLGSFVLNVLIGTRAIGTINLSIVLVGAGIALGAILQAYVGNVLLQKLFKHPIWREEFLGILALLVLAGPISCMVGATVGNGVLLASHSITGSQFLESWWNWWIGDSLGVLAVLPVGIVYMLKRQRIVLKLHRESNRDRQFASYILPALLVLISTILAFQITKNAERQRLYAVFENDTEIITQRLHENLDKATQILFSLQGLFDTADRDRGLIPVSRQQFKIFTDPYFERVRGIQAVGWNPVVKRGDRAKYEAYIREEGFVNFQFQQRDENNRLIPDRDRETYYPVLYIEPLNGNQRAFGFNLGSESRRLRTLELARDSGGLTATPPIKLAQETGQQQGVILYLPVYELPLPTTTADRQKSLSGYLSVVFRVGDLLETSFRNLVSKGIEFTLYDQPLSEMLYQSNLQETQQNKNAYMAREQMIRFGGRAWEIRFWATEAYIRELSTNEPMVVLLSGFFITGLTGAFSIAQIRNSILVNLLVEKRTYELERSQEAALQAASNAEKANRAKSNFLAIMSHELRTPLNSVLGFTECLKEDMFGPVTEEQRNALETVERNGRHLLALITDILDLSKIEEGKFEIELAPVDIELLCRFCLTLVKQQAIAKSITVNLDLPLVIPTHGNLQLMADERRLQQSIVNLLSNAVKFTSEGGSITLQVSLPDPDHPFIRFAVIDTGIGIAEADFHRLFHPFTQLDEALNRQYEGTGLGLSLVKRLVELHGGRVGVTSRVGFGSCFTIDLPSALLISVSDDVESPVELDDETEPNSGSTSESRSDCDRADHLDPLRGEDLVNLWAPTLKISPHLPIVPPLILLADDNFENAQTIARYLTNRGYRFLRAGNGREAVEMAIDYQPDLILMDIQMPEMNGLEAMELIRENPQTAHIPMIALTAFAMAGDRARCLAAGANEYLSKPVELAHLNKIIRSFFE